MPDWLLLVFYILLVVISSLGVQYGLRMSIKNPDNEAGPLLFWIGLFALGAAFTMQVDSGTRISIDSSQSQS